MHPHTKSAPSTHHPPLAPHRKSHMRHRTRTTARLPLAAAATFAFAATLMTAGPTSAAYTDQTYAASTLQMGTASDTASSIYAYADASAALDDKGRIWRWGVPQGDTEHNDHPIPAPEMLDIPGTRFTTLGVGHYHALALDTDGRIWAWGLNGDGQLGTGTTTTTLTPTLLNTGTTRFQAAAAGFYHSAALDTNGRLWTWGRGVEGQLGLGATNGTTTPTLVGPQTYKRLTANYHGTAMLDTAGNVWTTGRTVPAPNCDASKTPVRTPCLMSSGHNFQDIAGNQFTLVALDNTGTAHWGGTILLSDNTWSPSTDFPTKLNGPTGGYTKIAAGAYHPMALTADGHIWNMGHNSKGALGTTNPNDALTMVPADAVPPGVTFTHITTGNYHSLARDTDGNVWGWGYNDRGQVGNAQTGVVAQRTPQRIQVEGPWAPGDY